MKYPFSPEILDAMPERMAELYRTLEIRLLQEIAERLKEAGQLNEVTVQDIRALRSHGIKLDEIKKAIKEVTGTKELDKLFDDVVKRNEAYYGELVTLAEVTKPDELVNISTIQAIMKQTADEVRNITQSMGFMVGDTMLPPAKAYQWALDKAAIEVSSGAISYNQAIADATRELADSGLKVVEYESGHVDQVDVAVRRAVMTGITQVCDKYTDDTAEYLDSPYVEVSAHSGARDKPYPNAWSSHKAWQGKVYYQSKHGEKDPLGKYPDLVRSTGYGEVDGLCGANCRHRRHVWIEGVSEKTYTDEELKSIDPPPFEYEGQKYSHYEATQEQRRIERTIRKWKRREAAATNPEDKTAAQIRIRRLQEKYHEFSQKAGLREQRERMNVYQPQQFTDTIKGGINKTDIGEQPKGAIVYQAEKPINEQAVLQQFNWSGKPRTLKQILAQTNPHFGEGAEWDENCQRCLFAEEMQFRGYDVTAKPYNPNDRIGSKAFSVWDFDKKHWRKDSGFRLIADKTTFKQTVENAFSAWGDGARAIVSIQRIPEAGGGAHGMFVIKEKGRIVYSDPQSGIVVNIDKRLEKVADLKNRYWVMRVDNRAVKDAAEDAIANIEGGK